MQLYSGRLDYAATGEGCIICHCLMVAGSEERAREIMAGYVGEYYSRGFDFEEGISDSVRKNIKLEMLNMLEESPPFNFFWMDLAHVNYS